MDYGLYACAEVRPYFMYLACNLLLRRKTREKPKEAEKEHNKRKKPMYQVANVPDQVAAQKLQEFAQRLSEREGATVEKSDRRRLIAVAERVYENCLDPLPVCENLAKILNISLDRAKV